MPSGLNNGVEYLHAKVRSPESKLFDAVPVHCLTISPTGPAQASWAVRLPLLALLVAVQHNVPFVPFKGHRIASPSMLESPPAPLHFPCSLHVVRNPRNWSAFHILKGTLGTVYFTGRAPPLLDDTRQHQLTENENRGQLPRFRQTKTEARYLRTALAVIHHHCRLCSDDG